MEVHVPDVFNSAVHVSRLIGPRSRSGLGGEEKTQPLLEIELRPPNPWNLQAIQSEIQSYRQ